MTYIQLAVKDPLSGKFRPLPFMAVWHIMTDRGKGTACGRTMFTVASITERVPANMCRRCQERIQRPSVAARAKEKAS